jgi:hypothetical protein
VTVPVDERSQQPVEAGVVGADRDVDHGRLPRTEPAYVASGTREQSSGHCT